LQSKLNKRLEVMFIYELRKHREEQFIRSYKCLKGKNPEIKVKCNKLNKISAQLDQRTFSKKPGSNRKIRE